MCVILIAEQERPSPTMIEKAYQANSHGAGIAWREPGTTDEGAPLLNEEGEPIIEVRWQKGLTLDQLQERVASVPLPFVVHCRIASCGGQRPELTHPFPIDEEVELYLNGSTTGDVLFHNGHWNKWKEVAVETAKSMGVRLPEGKLSDTRIMAWCAHHYGRNFIELIDEKGVSFGPENMQIFWGTGWHLLDGVWASNEYFMTGGKRYGDVTGAYSSGHYSRICKHGTCRNMSHDSSGYCSQHREVPEIGNLRPTPPVVALPSTPTPDATGNSSTDEDDTTPVVVTTTTVTTTTSGPGGAAPRSPFVQYEEAQQLFREGKLSKTKLKRARKFYERSQRMGMLTTA